MKNMRKLIPALCLLLVSAMMLGTSTFAWFSMNTKVTATGMVVQAKAEGGLLISSTHQDGTWSNRTAITLSKGVQMLPASTANGATWYHAHSTDSNNSTAIAEGYYTLTASDDADPTGQTTATAGNIKVANENLFTSTGGDSTLYYDENGTNTAYDAGTDDGFYLLTKYYIRSSGSAITVGSSASYASLAINTIKVDVANSSAELDKSLRIGIAIYDTSNALASTFVVLAPVNGADGVTASSGAVSAAKTTVNLTDVAAYVGLCAPADSGASTPAIKEYNANVDTGFAGSIPANTSSQYLTAYIYVWFEGEDSVCYADNITTTLDSLSIEVSFKITNTAAEYNGICTAIPTT